jgi:hypothetical protein
VVSADVTLPLNAPLAEPAEMRRAQWHSHHLPHNLDRELGLTDADARRKRELLAHMDDDRDPRRRAAAFAELHAINARLATAHADALRQAEERLHLTRVGVANRELVGKRDWSFALYPAERVATLASAMDDRLNLAVAR